jgi:transcriptional regulator with XRE-family HTH domain
MATDLKPSGVGARIKYLRMKRVLTQIQMAAHTGIHHSLISQWENGQEPNILSIQRVASFFDVDPVWLAYGGVDALHLVDSDGKPDA